MTWDEVALQLSDTEMAALRARAAREQRSVQEVARAAVREYVERHDRDEVDRAAIWVTTNFREALDRLGRV